MIREISCRTMPLTHDLAERFANMDASKGERPLKESRIIDLQNKITNGLFHSPTWATAYIKSDPSKRRVRVNGQHTSRVLASSNGDFPTGLQVTLQDFECDTDDDIALLFAQFDSPASARSTNDTLGANANIHPQLREISTRFIKTIVDGIAFHMTPDGSRGPNIDGKARLVHAHVEFIAFAADYMKVKAMKNKGVCAAMLATYHRASVVSKTFWDMVVSESHADNRHPTRLCAKMLSEQLQKRAASRLDTRAIYVKCIHFWNAYRRDTYSEGKYYAGCDLPKAI